MKLLYIPILILLTAVIGFSQQSSILKVEDMEEYYFYEQQKGLRIKEFSEYKQSKRWAILIGINDYEDEFINDLDKARNDAKALTDVFGHEGQFDHVFTFTDDYDPKSENYPTLKNIKKRLAFLKKYINQNDTFIFAFSGHGISNSEGKSFLMTADTDLNQPFETSLALEELQAWVTELDVKKSIIFLDACRNEIQKTKGINLPAFISHQIIEAELSAVFYSTSPGQYSFEHHKEPYGVFSAYLIKGLKGAADYNFDGVITFTELRMFTEKEMNAWSLLKLKSQTPHTAITGEFKGDIVLSLVPNTRRQVFNPKNILNHQQKRLLLTRTLRNTSLPFMITGVTGLLTGGILVGVGYSNYSSLTQNNDINDWLLHINLQSAGFYAIIFSSTAFLSGLIPFIISQALKYQSKKPELTVDVGYRSGEICAVLTIRPGMTRYRKEHAL